MVRNCYHRLQQSGDYDMIIQFYADDGIIAGKDYEKVQQMLDFIVKDFLAFGLELNSRKTEAMTMQINKRRKEMSTTAYDRKIHHVGLTYNERQKQIQSCQWCHKEVQTASLTRHYLSRNCIKERKKIENDGLCREVSLVYTGNNDNDIINNADNSVEHNDDYNNNDNNNNNNDGVEDDNDKSNNINNNDDYNMIFEVDMVDNNTIRCPVEGCSYFTHSKPGL